MTTTLIELYIDRGMKELGFSFVHIPTECVSHAECYRCYGRTHPLVGSLGYYFRISDALLHTIKHGPLDVFKIPREHAQWDHVIEAIGL